MSDAMLKDKEREVRVIAEKAVRMSPQSLHTLIFATDVLIARDQMEHKEQVVEEI